MNGPLWVEDRWGADARFIRDFSRIRVLRGEAFRLQVLVMEMEAGGFMNKPMPFVSILG